MSETTHESPATPAKTKQPRKAAQKRPAKSRKQQASGAGPVSKLAGKKLFKTAKGNDARRGETRRTRSWAALKSGVTYETAVKNGVVPADLAKMVSLKHVEVR